MILEMKNTRCQIKSSVESLISRIEHEKNRVSVLKKQGREIRHPVKINDNIFNYELNLGMLFTTMKRSHFKNYSHKIIPYLRHKLF